MWITLSIEISLLNKIHLPLYQQNQKTMTDNLKELVKSKLEREFNLNETMAVLRYNPSIFWSWGANQFTNVENRALLFRVSGHHHKGWVLITLAYDDTYSVYIVTNRAQVLNEYKMVYFDDLTELIDNRIEKIKDYQF
jgi:hypothetical protein